MSNYVMASTQTSTADFPVSKNRLIIFSFPALACLFPPTFLFRNVAFTPCKQASSLRKFKMAMKQPALASFYFKNSSNDQDKPSTTVSDLGLKKYGGISRQIHKLNNNIRYFVLCLCEKFPHHSRKCGGFLEKMGEKANPHPL